MDQRFNQVIASTPSNVVRFLKDDLAAKKIGPLFYECIGATDSLLQKHLAAVFIAQVRPIGWFKETLDYITLLHPRSFYLGEILKTLNSEVGYGDLESAEERQLKQLVSAVLSKCEYAPKISEKGNREIELNNVLCEENSLAIDMLLKTTKAKWPTE